VVEYVKCIDNPKYEGQPCQCASCWHVDGVCIDHDSGGGCAACDGPVDGCEPGEALDEEDEQELESCDRKQRARMLCRELSEQPHELEDLAEKFCNESGGNDELHFC